MNAMRRLARFLPAHSERQTPISNSKRVESEIMIDNEDILEPNNRQLPISFYRRS
jgi:hypothetical protein